MCLGIPGKVVETYAEHDVPMGKVDFGGVFKRVCLAHVPHASVGQYVIVHVGFALGVVDEAEARQIFEFLERMDELGELKDEQSLEVDAGPGQAHE
jgi:hydrogenase expression/formation protein HypC